MTSNTTTCALIAYQTVLGEFVLAQQQRHALLFQTGHRYFFSLDEGQLNGTTT